MISIFNPKAYARALMIALLFCVSQLASAGPYEDGAAAFRRGDHVTALRLLRPLANQGNPFAQYALAVMYAYGEAVPQDYSEAVKWYRLAASQGYANAQYYLGRMYDNGDGVVQDYSEAAKWYRLAASQGFADAQFGLALLYDNGHGVVPDYSEAVKWARLAANHGLAIAQLHLGFCYENGRGVARDYAEAAKWYRLSAGQGVAIAQDSLGDMYKNGQGVAQDYAEAMKWYRLAAGQGYALAQYALAVMYAYGEGVPQDYAEAVKWYRLAASQGVATAQYSLGLLYAKGLGVTQDYVAAHKWFNVAGIGGDKDALKARTITEGRMTSEQIAFAQEIASTCRASSYKKCGEPENNYSETTPPSTSTREVGSRSSSTIAIPLQKAGGTFVVPVLINNTITLNFVIDSGAADVSIPADVVRTLMRTGTIRQSDFLGKRTYVLADGSKVPSQTFRIRSMRVGDRTVENVTGSITTVEGSLLLGQSFLGRFKSWSIDNGKKALLLE